MLHPRSPSTALAIREEEAQPDVVELLPHGKAFSASLDPPEALIAKAGCLASETPPEAVG
jgi:hypothetical protein